MPPVDGGLYPPPPPPPVPPTNPPADHKDSLAIAVEALSALGQDSGSPHSPVATRPYWVYEDDRARSAAPSTTTSPRGHSIRHMGPPYARWDRGRTATAHNVTNVNGAGMYYVSSISMNDLADKAVDRDRRAAATRADARIGTDGIPRDPYTGWPVAVSRGGAAGPAASRYDAQAETHSSRSGSDAGVSIAGTVGGGSATGTANGHGASGALSAANNHSSSGRSQLRRNLRDAMDGFLFNENDSYPFSTIWSSDPEMFRREVSSLWQQTDELTDDLNSFSQFFAPKWPGLAGPSLLRGVQTFIDLSDEDKRHTPLPDLALYLMVFALGRNGNLESPKIGAFQGYWPPDQRGSQPMAAEASNEGPVLAAHADVSMPGDWTTGARDDPTSGQDAMRTRSPYFVTDRYLSATYQALRLCSFLSAPTLQTIHAQLLVGLYLRNTDRTASFWPLLGSITRQAQAIGLHIDPVRLRPQPDPLDAVNRRTLWWAIVLQDAQLSAIYGRPLAIAWFTTRVTNPPGGSATPPTLPTGGPSSSAAAVSLMPPASEGPPTTYHEAQCGLAMLMRQRLLDPSQAIDWDVGQLAHWTKDGLSWYLSLPPALRLDITDTSQLHDPNLHAPGWLVKEVAAAGGREWSNSSAYRGLKDIQQACDLAMDVFAVLMFTHRGHLGRERSLADQQSRQPGKTGKAQGKRRASSSGSIEKQDEKDAWLRSPKAVCTLSIAVMRSALHLMNAHLGHLRSFSMWRTLYLCFHAGVTAAFITLLWPTDPAAQHNLISIQDLCAAVEKAPTRWKELPKMRHALRVLAQLTANQVEAAQRTLSTRSPSPAVSKRPVEQSPVATATASVAATRAPKDPTPVTAPPPATLASTRAARESSAAPDVELGMSLPGPMLPLSGATAPSVPPVTSAEMTGVPGFPLGGDLAAAATAAALGSNLGPMLEGYYGQAPYWPHALTSSEPQAGSAYEPLERLTRLGALNANDLSAPDSTQPTSESVAWWSNMLGFDFSNPNPNATPTDESVNPPAAPTGPGAAAGSPPNPGPGPGPAISNATMSAPPPPPQSTAASAMQASFSATSPTPDPSGRGQRLVSA